MASSPGRLCRGAVGRGRACEAGSEKAELQTIQTTSYRSPGVSPRGRLTVVCTVEVFRAYVRQVDSLEPPCGWMHCHAIVDWLYTDGSAQYAHCRQEIVPRMACPCTVYKPDLTQNNPCPIAVDEEPPEGGAFPASFRPIGN